MDMTKTGLACIRICSEKFGLVRNRLDLEDEVEKIFFPNQILIYSNRQFLQITFQFSFFNSSLKNQNYELVKISEMNNECDSIKQLVLEDLKPSVITLGDELNLSVILQNDVKDEVENKDITKVCEETTKKINPPQLNELACSVCHKEFPSKRYLNRHFSRHTSRFKCSLCGKVFCRKETLLRHLLRCKENKTIDHPPKRGKPSSKDVNKYFCETCSKNFTRRENYDQHLMTHYGMQVVCYICDKVLRSFKSYRRHIKNHENEKPSIQCALCPAEFSMKSNLRRHIMQQHVKMETTCEKCNHRVKNESTLQRHKENETIPCVICSELFCLKSDLKTHLKLIHNNVWFICKECSGQTPFMTKCEYNLRNHAKKLHSIILESGDCYKYKWFAMYDA